MENCDCSVLISKPKIDYNKHSIANREYNEYNKKLRLPIQQVTWKYAKNHNWTTLKSDWNLDDKSINYKILIGPSNIKDIHVSYEDICKEFYWKSFDFNDEKISVFPEEMTFDEINEYYAPLLAKTKANDEKKAKELKEAKKNGETLTKC